MSNPGRNEPCPCGSGRKYKYCCLHHAKPSDDLKSNDPPSNDPKSPDPGLPTQIGSEIGKPSWIDPDLLDPEWDDFEDGSLLPSDEYLGLSPQELWTTVVPFFEKPDTIQVAEKVSSEPTGPLFTFLEILVDRGPIALDPNKTLPDHLVQELVRRISALPEYGCFSQLKSPRESIAHIVLHTCLFALYEAGVLQIKGNELIIDSTFRREIVRRDYRRVYPILFRSLAQEVVWGIPFENDPFGSMFGFVLFQLARMGDRPFACDWHGMDFFDAFPERIEWVNPDGDEVDAIASYTLSVVFGFWAVLGLVDIVNDGINPMYVTARPIYRELVQFPEEWLERCPDDSAIITERPPVDRDGLSPTEMDQLIYTPFNAPDVVTFADAVSSAHPAPILLVLQAILDAMAERPFKPTATGAFPRAFSREMAHSLWAERDYEGFHRHSKVNKEADVFPLHISRLILELAGVLRKYKGRFIIGRAYRSDLEQRGVGALYGHLFRTAAKKLDWGYGNAGPEFPRIQQLFGFTVRLLYRYGDTPRPETFYSDAFLRAFPIIVQEAEYQEPRYWSILSEWVTRKYENQTLNAFAHLMGLATVSPPVSGRHEDPSIIQATPLLKEFVRFHV